MCIRDSYNTSLDSMLRARGIKNLAFCGIATNVCVESTLRDGFFLEYFGVLLEDATHQAGPAFLQEATVYNVEKFFGWVSNTAPFSPGTLADGVVYVSGTLAFDKDNNVAHVGDAEAQTRHVLETIKSVIETAGGTMDDVTTVS